MNVEERAGLHVPKTLGGIPTPVPRLVDEAKATVYVELPPRFPAPRRMPCRLMSWGDELTVTLNDVRVHLAFSEGNALVVRLEDDGGPMPPSDAAQHVSRTVNEDLNSDGQLVSREVDTNVSTTTIESLDKVAGQVHALSLRAVNGLTFMDSIEINGGSISGDRQGFSNPGPIGGTP